MDMMISPETYYRNNIEGRSEKEILHEIRRLKREISSLISTLEHPDYNDTFRCDPSESTRLYWTREYLEKAEQGLEEAGATYQPTKAECKAALFDENACFINKLEFTIGGYDGGYETTTIRFDEERLYMDVNHTLIPKPINFHIEPDYLGKKENFIESLKKLHIGEWRKKYTLERFGYSICDGTQWELSIYYDGDIKPVRIYGDNAYPYNFDKLLELLGKDAEDVPEVKRKRYQYLTKYIHYFKDGGYQKWLQAKEDNAACKENVCVPFDRYTEMLSAFVWALRSEARIYKDIEIEDSKEILDRNGIDPTRYAIRSEDIERIDAQCILVLLNGVAKSAEMFLNNEHILRMIFQDSRIIKYLERLETLHTEI